ncbi:MAG: MarR family transcriptional regulator [Firmicutes bacterium]|nr:MarR family transcriptional regulator [Bacillota bacterium]
MVDLELLDLTLKLFLQTLQKEIYEPLTQGEDSLTPVQESCLRFIYYHQTPLAKEVADGLQISNAAVTKLIDRLERKGLVVREYPKNDRRQVTLALTEAGLKLLETARFQSRKRLAAIMNRLDPETQVSFMAGLKAFLTAALVNTEQLDRVCLRCGRGHVTDCPGNIIYRGLTGENRFHQIKEEED